MYNALEGARFSTSYRTTSALSLLAKRKPSGADCWHGSCEHGHVLPDCDSIGEGEPDRDWNVAPFSGDMVVFISKLGDGPRPNTRLPPPPGGPPFRDPFARSTTQCTRFKPQAQPTSLTAYYRVGVLYILLFQITGAAKSEFLINPECCCTNKQVLTASSAAETEMATVSKILTCTSLTSLKMSHIQK
jgi:hypothetical protein